jgi:hypothetical protein
MRLFKLFTSSLVVGLIALFIHQNKTTFLSVHEFTLDLFIREQLKWSHHLYTLLILSTLIGLALGLGIMLKPYKNARRLLAQERQEKHLVASLDSQPTPSTTKQTSPAS